MTEETAKRKRKSKTDSEIIESLPTSDVVTASLSKPKLNQLAESFDDLLGKIAKSKTEFESLQKRIDETKEAFQKEKKAGETAALDNKRQVEWERKKESEVYQYETEMARRRAEEAFNDKLRSWEKDFEERKNELAQEKKELEDLRKKASGFEAEKVRAAEEAIKAAEKTLNERFETEKVIREQEYKAEKDILNLRIANLTAENQRQLSEITALRKALDEANRQVKEIAVKVIESGNQRFQPSPETQTRQPA